ncbi:unnamed protein product [Sphenostylis stenocarpa]|uniref:Uncharacterized protein n=1 Tax=Sphenostylis stenocarpa TaxID=92480 RepID=A0AA86SXW3_9FABA|nr:unnamed protein product [Sphenostylis stenocarpa]
MVAVEGGRRVPYLLRTPLSRRYSVGPNPTSQTHATIKATSQLPFFVSTLTSLQKSRC